MAPHGSFMRGLTETPLFSGGEWELIGFGEPTVRQPTSLCRHCDIAGRALAPWSAACATPTRALSLGQWLTRLARAGDPRAHHVAAFIERGLIT